MLVAAFKTDFLGTTDLDPRFAVLALGESILERAAALLSTNPLRAYDSIQLASALAARDADPELDCFACFDGSLRDAAAITGLRPCPPGR